MRIAFPIVSLLIGSSMMMSINSYATNGKEPFDIAPFGLPRCASGEVRFEEPRDIVSVVVRLKTGTHTDLGLSYLKQNWPEQRLENFRPFENPCAFGWFPIDDGFNSEWKAAQVDSRQTAERLYLLTFRPLATEFPQAVDYNVLYRRTLGVRIDTDRPEDIESIQVFTTSPTSRSCLRITLDNDRRTPGEQMILSTYNSQIDAVTAIEGVEVKENTVRMLDQGKRSFEVALTHMRPSQEFRNDEGHLTFNLGEEAFTISLAALEKQGPIWFEEMGVFITQTDDPTTFEDYRGTHAQENTYNRRVQELPEQSLSGAINGQPRRHPVACSLGCKHVRQRFWIETNGDVVLRSGDLNVIKGKDSARFLNRGDGRFYFGLERCQVEGRYFDPAPIPAYNIHLQRDGLRIEQKSFAIPLEKSILDGHLAGDDSIVALVRFRWANQSDREIQAQLPIHYSAESRRSESRMHVRHHSPWDNQLVPRDPLEKITAEGHLLTGQYGDRKALRARYDTTMAIASQGEGVVFSQVLKPGETCELLLKVPYIALDTPAELDLLAALDFESGYQAMSTFWRREVAQGATLKTPEPRLDALHSSHLTHVYTTDIAMPDGSGLVNTSVGTSIYGNYTNESCMIVHELDQRGLHEEARKRIEVWIKYQGTAATRGNFTDREGVFFGAGGFERGDSYTQHHGWVLWIIAEHYFLSGEADWLAHVADPLIQGMEWVFRQRKETMKDLPHSRGWEYGFLPAGALEDVTDYYYWLSTNALTWRGVNHAARALSAINHPEAARLQREADAYGKDLRRGFDTMRRMTPLVHLRDGRWVPTFPSRLYLRGRDMGWIREILEGAVYLLISGLYSPTGREAGWILDDYQDNRYPLPPYGYLITDIQANWFDQSGFSIQPNLLAGLLPHLDRDETKIYDWMFFNAWAACYNEEINAMVEHPYPFLGYANSAHYKTSDEANAINWLRYMFVYSVSDTLHIGRAIPVDWFAQGKEMTAADIATHYGKVSVNYIPQLDQNQISAVVDLSLRNQPAKTLVRFRHPDGLNLRAVKVNGKEHASFDAGKGDVDLTGMNGNILVEAQF